MKKLNEQVASFKKTDDLKKELKRNFLVAKKEESFLSLIESLPIKEEMLYNYTSLLEDCSVENANCKNCKNLLECKNEIIGYAYSPVMVDDNLEFVYLPCRYQKKRIKETEYLKNVFNLSITESLKYAQMKEIDKSDENRYEVITWLNKFIKNYPNVKKGLYLHGNFGCGKTYLIVAMFNELAKKDIKSATVYWPEFLRYLKGSFSSDFNEKFEMIKQMPILLLDDIGAENSTEWSRDEILGSLLQYRMENDLLTFFTSNFSLKELEEHLKYAKDKTASLKARRIIERIQYLTEEYQIIGKNMRN